MNELHQLDLSQQNSAAPVLSAADMQIYLQQLPDWQQKSPGIEKTFVFHSYLSGLEFSQQLALLAESVDHHPLITLAWRKVTVAWWTHTINGLHKNDFIMAAKTDKLGQSFERESD